MTLDFYEANCQGWFLDVFSNAFIIQPLRELTLRGLRLGHGGWGMMTRKLRQTELKALRIERSYIDILGLKAILAIPKALGTTTAPRPIRRHRVRKPVPRRIRTLCPGVCQSDHDCIRITPGSSNQCISQHNI